LVPESRSSGIRNILIPGFFTGLPRKGNWAEEVSDEDTLRDRMRGWICLAAVSRFERRHFAERLAADRLTVPQLNDLGQNLEDAWRQLPRVEVLGSPYPIYEGLAPGGVVRIADDIAESHPRWGLTLCPRAADQVGLRTADGEPFVYRDSSGEVAVRTVWWREGGFRVSDVDDAIRAHGSLLIARPQYVERLRRVVGETLRVSAWRAFEKGTSIKGCSAHHRTVPT
jgi:hypothetical protein